MSTIFVYYCQMNNLFSPHKRVREVNEPKPRHYLAILSTFLIDL